MSQKIIKSNLKKVTINLPVSVLDLVDSFARQQETDRNKMIIEILSKAAQERFEAEMSEAYLENAEEAQEIAEEFFPLTAEIWPEWETEDKKQFGFIN